MRALITIALLFFMGCKLEKKVTGLDEFELKLMESLLYSTKIEDLKYNDEVITRPLGLEQFIFSSIIPGDKTRAHRRLCFYHTVGFKEKKGDVKVSFTRSELPCEESVGNGESELELHDVKNLKISLQKFNLILSFDHLNKKQKIEIPLYNLVNGSVHQKYKAQEFMSLSSGLRLVSPHKNIQNYLGKKTDRFSNGSAIRCHQVDDKCKTIGEDLCDQCKFGWYEVVDFKCPTGGSKFCGQNVCGEKNEPACPIGKNISPDQDAGICHGDLTPTLNSDKIWVCQ